jgi:hypothetical protein
MAPRPAVITGPGMKMVEAAGQLVLLFQAGLDYTFIL